MINLLLKIFVDDTSLSIKTTNRSHSDIELNIDLKMISQQAYQRKTLFGPDSKKLAIEVGFSNKYDKVSHQLLAFNNDKIQFAPSQKHLRLA